MADTATHRMCKSESRHCSIGLLQAGWHSLCMHTYLKGKGLFSKLVMHNASKQYACKNREVVTCIRAMAFDAWP